MKKTLLTTLWKEKRTAETLEDRGCGTKTWHQPLKRSVTRYGTDSNRNDTEDETQSARRKCVAFGHEKMRQERVRVTGSQTESNRRTSSKLQKLAESSLDRNWR